MTRRMLINAINPAELRVALADGKNLEDFKVDVAERGLTRGNIYFGYIANIQPSLNAAFIDYGAERHGFLPIQDVVPDAYYRELKKGAKPRIEEVLEKGRPIVVQVTREPEGQKGAALTTNLSLAGRYLVLMPFERTRGISRKVNSEEERRKLAELVERMRIPQECGVIVRTNALDQTKTALTRDLNALLRLWKKIGEEARTCRQTKLLYSDQDIVLQALRDNLDSAIEEVIVDAEQAHARAREYMQAFMPRSKTKLIRFEERIPLFAAYKIEEQIDRIYDRKVALPSGGSIVLDHAEALTAIDVNSGKSTKAASQEETALHTNLEAAVEVARHLRLRDIGGLIVVDFIDMRNRRNQKKVEKALRDAMKADKARFTVGRISSNGLLEINRQRLEQAIQMRTHRACPTCSGTGRILSPEIVALHLVRAIEARASGGYMKAVRIEMHPELADYVQNHRRRELLALEDEFDISIEIVASSKLHRPDQDTTWTARDRDEIKRIERERAEAAERAKAERELARKKAQDEARAAADGGAEPGTSETLGSWPALDVDVDEIEDEDAEADDDSSQSERESAADSDASGKSDRRGKDGDTKTGNRRSSGSRTKKRDDSDSDGPDGPDGSEDSDGSGEKRAKTDSADDEDDARSDGPPRRRRRRRGGRRRKRSSSSAKNERGDAAQSSKSDGGDQGSSSKAEGSQQTARGGDSKREADGDRSASQGSSESKDAKSSNDSREPDDSNERRPARRGRRRGGRRGRGGAAKQDQDSNGGGRQNGDSDANASSSDSSESSDRTASSERSGGRDSSDGRGGADRPDGSGDGAPRSSSESSKSSDSSESSKSSARASGDDREVSRSATPRESQASDVSSSDRRSDEPAATTSS